MTAGQIRKVRIIYKDRHCAYCGWLKSALSWWCTNTAAIKARGTSIPPVCHCPFWKPDKNYIKKELKK